MAIIEFRDDNLRVNVPDGSRLQEAIDSSNADIPFGCREGNCATCIIEVLAGGEHLTDPTENEQITLLPDELADNLRLACQCRVQGGMVSIRRADAF